VSDPRLGVVDKILNYADRPWRVIAVIVLALAGAGGYALWEQRATIAAKILEDTVVPRLEPQRFPQIAQQLLAGTHADLVMVQRIDLAVGQLVNIDGRLAGDQSWRPPPEPRSVFDAVTTAEAMALIAGHVVCSDVPTENDHRTAVELGMKRWCRVTVPPVPDVAVVGGLMIAWKTAPRAAAEIGYETEMQRLALKLATW